MSDFFSAVGGGLDAAASSTDDTKSFAEAIAARFGQGDSHNVLTARLLVPPTSLALPDLSILPPPQSPAGVIAITARDLSPWLDDPKTLVVDIRPHAAYSSARITRAISLSVPSTLLKRPLFSLQRLSSMLPSVSSRTRFSSWRTASRILVYDADSTTLGDSSNIQGLLRKFRAEAPDAQIALAWVVGGFQAVWMTRRDLVDVVPPTPDTETEDDEADDDNGLPLQRVLRASNLPSAAFSVASTTQAPRSGAGPVIHHPGLLNKGPSLLPGTAASNPFYDSVRQNTELAQGITERITLRLPRRIRRRIAELPFQWLREIARKAGPTTPPTALDAIRGSRPESSDESSDSSLSSGRRWRSAHLSPAPSPGPFFASPPPAPVRSYSESGAQGAVIEEGTEALAMQFYRIELSEQRRLMKVMEHHAQESGEMLPAFELSRELVGQGRANGDDKTIGGNPSRSKGGEPLSNSHQHPYSITAGVEKGAKNRYRNIWPFEHARVKLHQEFSLPTEKGEEREQDVADLSIRSAQTRLESGPHEDKPKSPYDDYVNASYVQPLGTRRRYIATQGPLEATFGDFWTLVWQQNVHVVVMLTREIEGASIKCGAYWHPGTYGPLRVELLGCAAEGCTGVCPVCAGQTTDKLGGGGFFSDFGPTPPQSSAAARGTLSPRTPEPPASSQLIKRTLRLTHTGHPAAPPRRVVQLQYLGWPDMNVPEDARGVLGLIWEIQRVMDEVEKEEPEPMEEDADTATPGSDVDEATGVLKRALRGGNMGGPPLLLHCSAGVGRTGGFIIIDAILDAIRQEAREMYAAKRSEPLSRREVAGSGGEGGIAAERTHATGSVSAGSGSESLGGIVSAIGAADIQASAPVEENRMDVDADANAASKGGNGMRTPMQVDNAEMGLGMSDMGETRRWAQRVADTDIVSAFAPPAFPGSSSASSSSVSLPLTSSFSLPPLAAPFQLKPPVNRSPFPLALPSTMSSLPSTRDSDSQRIDSSEYEQRNPQKAASDPIQAAVAATGSIPLAMRRGYGDHRLRTISEPNAPTPPSEPRATSTLRLLAPDRMLANSPLPIVKSPSLQPERERIVARSVSPFDAQLPIPAHRAIRSMDSADYPQVAASPRTLSSGGVGQALAHVRAVDYSEPRLLHTHGGPEPVRLSTFENPVSEVLQDMREQRMSLCQSLRQYVFVHAAIIEGALMVADEERARAGIAGVVKPPALALSPRGSRPRLRLSKEDTQSTPSTGKRLASPTELTKEDKRGEIALSKRPSVKRKQESHDGFTPPLLTFPPP